MKSMEKEEGRKENDKGSRDRGKEEKVSREEDRGGGGSKHNIIKSKHLPGTPGQPEAALRPLKSSHSGPVAGPLPRATQILPTSGPIPVSS